MNALPSARLVSLCLGLGLTFSAFADETVLLGVVEAMPDASAPPDAVATPHLRLAFRYQHGRWTAICEEKRAGKGNAGCRLEEPDDAREWQVVFNGKPLGMVESKGWRDSKYYSFTGAQTITAGPIPEVTEPTASFSAWYGTASRRPLAAVAGEPQRSDIQRWSRETPTAADAALAWPIFRAKVPTIPSCNFSDEGKALGHSRKSRASDMEVFDRVSLSSGGHLLGLRARSSLPTSASSHRTRKLQPAAICRLDRGVRTRAHCWNVVGVP